MPPTVYNDHNVYILGAGFCAEAGLPMVPQFMNVLGDCHQWLQGQGRLLEADAVGKVLEFRLKAAGAAHRVRFDPENIEELFSLAAASVGGSIDRDVRLAIAATIDFAASTLSPSTVQPRRPEIRVDQQAGWTAPATWSLVQPIVPGEGGYYQCPLYEFYVGLMAGALTGALKGARHNTIITFNYDLIVESALSDLGKAYSYGFKKKTVNFDDSAKCVQAADAHSVDVLKLHGSVNWALPGSQGRKMTVYGSYSHLVANELCPIIAPPTWRKVITRQIEDVWKAAVSALSTATRVLVIGFSIPRTDPHFKYLIAAGLRENISLRQFLFVNPSAPQLVRRLHGVVRREKGVVDALELTTAQFFFEPDWRRRINRELAAPYSRHPDEVPTWAK